MTIFGFPVPFSGALLLSVLSIHVVAGLVSAAAGVVAMFSPKRTGRHPLAGSIYYWSLAVVFLSMTVLAITRWTTDYDLFVLGALSILAATIGRLARRRLIAHWASVHIIGMGSSYVLLLTAFYVDNGKSLPLWRDLPAFAFWLLPGIVGMPIMTMALVKYLPAFRSEGRSGD